MFSGRRWAKRRGTSALNTCISALEKRLGKKR